MAYINLITKLPIVIKSGEKKPLTVTLEDWVKPPGGGNKSKPQLYFSVDGGEGVSFEKNTLTTKPTRKDMTLTVVINTNDSAIKPLEFGVIVKKEEKPVKISPIHADLISGETIRFSSESPFKGFNPVYKIKDLGHGMGNLNPSTGEYKTPDAITERKDILVMAIDQNYPGPEINFAEAAITLFPVEMRDRDVEANPDKLRIIRAGSKATQLNVESHHDMAGLTNYTVKFTGQVVGMIEEGGTYTPPRAVNNPIEVEIQATSKLDSTKKIKHKFIVAPTVCSCGIEMVDGTCQTCEVSTGTGKYSLSILKKFRRD